LAQADSLIIAAGCNIFVSVGATMIRRQLGMAFCHCSAGHSHVSVSSARYMARSAGSSQTCVSSRLPATPRSRQGRWLKLRHTPSAQEVNMRKRADHLGVQMTDEEVRGAVLSMPRDTRGRITPRLYRRWLDDCYREKVVERLALVGFVESEREDLTQKLLTVTDVMGTIGYCIIGTLAGGDAGFHVVGATFIGCTAALGGGTLNCLLLRRPQVFWVENPRYLGLAIATSLATFYTWPHFEKRIERREREDVRTDADGCVTLDEFKAWLQRDGEFAQRLQRQLRRKLKGKTKDPPTPEQLFDHLDIGGCGKVPLRSCIRSGTFDSPVIFWLDAAVLSSFAVSGAQAGITRGVHPLVCVTTGVTICFGGILRDMLTQSDKLALGTESFALATGMGSAVYVGLRQLMLTTDMALPLSFRVACTCATVLSLRWLAWTGLMDNILVPWDMSRKA